MESISAFVTRTRRAARTRGRRGSGTSGGGRKTRSEYSGEGVGDVGGVDADTDGDADVPPPVRQSGTGGVLHAMGGTASAAATTATAWRERSERGEDIASRYRQVADASELPGDVPASIGNRHHGLRATARRTIPAFDRIRSSTTSPAAAMWGRGSLRRWSPPKRTVRGSSAR